MENIFSIFAYSVSNVMIINMRAQDIGRYNASNYELFSTIFRINFASFKTLNSKLNNEKKENKKRKLLFIISDLDHSSNKSEFKISEMLKEDIRQIWTKAYKAVEKNSSKLISFEEFMKLEFYFLPNPIYDKESYDVKIKAIREKIDHKNKMKAYSNTEYTENLPLDSYPEYLKNIIGKLTKGFTININLCKEEITKQHCISICNTLMQKYQDKLENLSGILISNANSQANRNNFFDELATFANQSKKIHHEIRLEFKVTSSAFRESI